MKYTLDETYFNKIDTKQKAYILGFIYADGNVSIKDNSYRLRFNLQQKDKSVLDFIKQELKYTGPIRLSKNKKYNILEISSKKLIKNLIILGAIPNKSLILLPPKIDPIFEGSFIKGYFDGDGCVGFYPRKSAMKPYIVICGTLELLYWIQEKINSKHKLCKVDKIYKLNFSSFQTIINFYYLTKLDFGLNRKTIILDNIAAYIEQSNRIKNLNNGENPKPVRATTVASTNSTLERLTRESVYTDCDTVYSLCINKDKANKICLM
jgi:hypothetical protein